MLKIDVNKIEITVDYVNKSLRNALEDKYPDLKKANIRRKPKDKIYAIQVFAMRSIIKIFKKSQEIKKIKN